MLHSMGVHTGIDLEALLDVAEYMEAALRKPLAGRYLRAARGPWRPPEDLERP
jgi:isopropylmalate/homocitrate/citramalate synthase